MLPVIFYAHRAEKNTPHTRPAPAPRVEENLPYSIAPLAIQKSAASNIARAANAP